MRINPVNTEEIPIIMRPFAASQRKKYQKILSPTLLWAWIPEAYLAFVGMYTALTRKNNAIDPKLRLLATLRVAQMNHCAFCID